MQDGINGIIIRRDIDEMANAIIYLHDNRDVLEGFSKKIKKNYLDMMSNEKNIGKIRKVLEKLN
jgi:glycosyltransferase involved in cell wall biosynthesis